MMKDNFFKKAAFMKNKTLFLSLMIVMIAAGVWFVLAVDLSGVTMVTPENDANISGTYVFNATVIGYAHNVTFYYNSSETWVEICSNGTSGEDINFSCSIDTNVIPNATGYIINATAYNATGANVNSTSITTTGITFDNAAPTVSEITSTNDTWRTTLNFTIAINASDVIDSLLGINVYVNGTSNVTATNNVTNAGTDVTLTGLLDNSTYLLILEVTDDSGNKKNSSEFILKYDTAKPYSSSLYPTDASYVNDATPLIYALVSDPGSGVVNSTTNIVMKQDGNPVTKTVVGSLYQVNVSYTVSSAITEGVNTTITLDANDTADNSMTQASWWFVIDLTNPAVTGFGTNDTDYNVTNSTSLNFSVTVTDTGGAGVSTVTMNGTTLTSGAGNTWYTENTTAQFDCGADDDCVFGITVTDAAGNTNTTETLTLKIDNINPAVTSFAVNDTDYNVTSTAYLNFSVTVADDGAGVSTVTMNGTTLTHDGNSWYTVNQTDDFTGAPIDGSCEFLITATDNAGNTNTTETITIKIDDVNPVVTSFAINDSDYNVTSTVYLNFSVTVTDSNISTVTMNGTTLTQAGTTWYTVNTTANFSAPTDGSCEFLITATDLIGNENATETITIKIDDVNPLVTEFKVNHTNYNVTNSTSLNFSVTVTDATAGVSTVTMNGTTLTQAGTTWYTENTTADFTCGADGDCIFLITATDYAGNENATEIITLKLDNVNPVVSISYPTASQNISSTILWVNGTASDTNNVTNANITINDSSWGTNLGTYANWAFQNITAISDGDYSIKITANDSAGNLNNTETVTFTVDNAAPTASAWVPTNESYSNSGSPTISVNISDSISGVLNSSVTMEISNTGGGWVDVTGSSTRLGSKSEIKITFSSGSYSNGANLSIRVNADDYAGNSMAQTQWWFVIDLVNPAVTLFATNDTNYNVTNTTSLNFSVTVTDSTAGVSTVTMNGTTLAQIGSTNVWFNENTTAQFDCGADGDCVFGITATDAAGNTNTTETLTLKIDNINPVVTGFRVNDTSSDNITRSDVYLNFSVTVSDATADVNTVTMNGTTLTQGGTTWYTVNKTSEITGCTLVTDGACTFLITATDHAGNANSTETMTITIDDVNPPVTNFAVNDTNYNVTNSTSLNFSVTITGTGGAGVSTVTMNGTTLTQAGTTWYTENTTAHFDCGADGDCVFGITATDNVSNVNDTEIITLLVDNINPAVTLFATNDTDNIVRSADYLNFSVTVIDATANVSTVTMNDTTLEWITGTDVWYTVNQTDEFTGCTSTGACTFLITATDHSGNVNNTEILTITIDDDNPGVFSFDTNDTDNIVRSADYLNFSVTANDTGGGSVDTVTINGTSLSQITGTDVWYNINQTDNWTGCTSTGACTFLITATDNVSNVNATETLTITIDDDNTGVFSFGINDSDYNVTSTVYLNFSVTVNDTGGGSVSTVTMNGTTLTHAGDTWYTVNRTVDWDDCTTNGLCVFGITATDNVSNVNNTETIILMIDTTAPTISLISPGGGDWTSDNTTDFTFTATDTLSSVLSCILYADGTNVGSNSSVANNTLTTITSTSELDEGAIDWTVNCTDGAGNEGTATERTVKIDVTPPTFTVSQPSLNQNVNSSALTILSSAANDGTGSKFTGVTSCAVEFTDNNGVSTERISPGTISFNGTHCTGESTIQNTAANGNGTLTLKLLDHAGNEGSATQYIDYTETDPTAPTINKIELNGTQFTAGSSIFVTVNATDNTAVSSVTADGVALTQYGDIWNGTVTAASGIGSHAVIIVATDTVGKIDTQSVSYEVVAVADTTPPGQVTGLTSLVWTGGINRNIMVNWTANTESDLDYYRVYINDVIVGPTTKINEYTYPAPYDGTWTVNVSAVDTSGNEGTPSTSVSVTIDASGQSITAATTSPVKDSSGTITDNTPLLLVNTSVEGYCKYDTSSKSFATMANTMNGATTEHNITLSALQDASSYGYYIRCNDTYGTAMTSSEPITFNLDTRSLYNITRPYDMYNYWLTNKWWDFTLKKLVLDNSSLTNYNVATVLASVEGNYNMIYAWNTTHFTSYVPGRAVNDLVTFNVSNVPVDYTIYTNTTDRLEIN